MKFMGDWHNIKHYSEFDDFSLKSIYKFIQLHDIDILKIELIAKNGYIIELKKHPTGNIKDYGLCEINGKKILIYIPDKLNNTKTYILFGEGEELEFSRTTLVKTIANELVECIIYIWNNLLKKKTYIEYLNKTTKMPD